MLCNEQRLRIAKILRDLSKPGFGNRSILRLLVMIATAYSVHSVGSYMEAMKSMVQASEKFGDKLNYAQGSEIDLEQLSGDAESAPGLTVLSQDRNNWDDVFDEFSHVSSENLFRLIGDGNNRVAKRVLSRLLDMASTAKSPDVDMEIFLQSIFMVLNVESLDVAQNDLFNLLGDENIDFISFVIQNKAQILKYSVEDVLTLGQLPDGQEKFMTQRDIRNQVLQNAQDAKNQALLPAQFQQEYRHVYRKHEAGSGLTLSFTGQKYALPAGSTRQSYQMYEEIIIPKADQSVKNSVRVKEIRVSELDLICRSVFTYDTLNKIQSIVFPVAYDTNENMLICAPTGAGKTDIALLTILNIIKQYSEINADGQININFDSFKVVYVAPLKALAAEIVEKFGRKLAKFDVKVRELTGDMQLTKAEILETQVIVTTPEKWDVVTRKGNGDNDLVSKVKLLIIDEVHLLHEDRGSVIETLVARTLRQVESSQSMIRILGLSATLPNFMDVADFLGVNRQVGMFYFDQSFRPKALEQQLLGCRGKAGSRQARENIDKTAYERVIEMVQKGSQVMVFVHSRKETVKTARTFISMAQSNQEIETFSNDSPIRNSYSRAMTNNKEKDLKELFQFGFGVHHAGMSRSDRNLSERLFKDGAINVLVCTATLAWGVNLPADVVIIKGTQVYDSKKGGFSDLGISDVIQIFGRAGRPGFGSSHGIGILCTSSDRLDDYVSLITQQHPIESRLGSKLVDNLNAEISLGTVTNVEEGIQWLGYTYLFVRMLKNPLVYGINWDEFRDDPQLYEKRRDMIIKAARKIHRLQMIVFDEVSMHFTPKDLGRIASDFYLLNESVEIFNQLCNPSATEADVLAMISMSSEFDNIKFREEEAVELTRLLEDSTECQLGSELESAQGKTNVLLQAYISRARIFDSALGSDSNYVAQNSVRICRALFLIGVNRRWGAFSKVMLDICKSIERRLWSHDHPLCQFDLPETILRRIREKNPTMELLLDMESDELADLVNNKKLGHKLYGVMSSFPLVNIEAEIFPITTNVMRVHVILEPSFKWDVSIHGNAQFFWVFVEESDKSQLLHFEKFILGRRQLSHPHELDFMIPLSDPLPPQVVVKVVSDSWIGAESTHPISFQHLIRPHNETLQTRLQKLNPLPRTALNNKLIEEIYPFRYFNPMQTMTFHTLYHSNNSVFVGSPTGSGKTVAAELAMWHAFRKFPGSKIVYIAPMKALVRERVDDWRKRITPVTGDKVIELTGDSIPNPQDVRDATIIITTPEKFDGISRNWQTRKFVQQVSLIIMDEIHLLASDRGPILEMIVSRMNYVSTRTSQPVRLLGISTAVSNAYDMAGWLGVKDNGLYNFSSSIRPVPLKMYIDGFPDNLAFCPLMKTMNKPAFMDIKQHSPNKPVLIFVASRRQTRLTALDLIHLCGMEENPRRFLNIEDEGELQYYISQVTDDTLKLSLQFGIGLHHAGLVEKDRSISHKLFQSNRIQVLVATSTLAWGVNLPAHLVIIKGTQFFDAKIEGYRDMDLTDILQMMGRAGRPAYDTSGTAIVYTRQAKKMFYKHFLNVGFPVESSLHKVLDDHLGAEIASGSITNRQEAMDFLSWTFFFRRAHHNPTYYGITEDTTPAGINQHLSALIDTTLKSLEESQCAVLHGDEIEATSFLSISSYYYISHKTVRLVLRQIYDGATFRDVLKWLSLAIEFNELPVRNGEIIMNEEMSAQSRYNVESTFTGEEELPMWDPHVKTFLLLQAHLSRVDLPIADYHQDTVSVLDQALRILQAYVDIASELGFYRTVMTVIKVMQCVKQGCWYEDDPLTTLPGVPLKRRSGLDFTDLGYPTGADQKSTLEELGSAGFKKLEAIARKLNVAQDKLKDFKREAQRLPLLKEIEVEPQSSPDKMIISAKHVNSKCSRNFEVWCDRFPKTQKELWFVIGYQGNELMMIKRCQPKVVQGQVSIICDFILPKELQGEKLDFTLICDAQDISYQFSYVLIK
ncbi:LAMI_0F15720g1_1 [Lachancea mirantina]|uniref:LAMI_0F15720g1_1 n=1 Tax=Lachancea mirantina TaxID=1230905 RepID=A0A1G4K4I1_9SACH|nr:LAMI_0F15720g1_1 [Lachancea mirantina]